MPTIDRRAGRGAPDLKVGCIGARILHLAFVVHRHVALLMDLQAPRPLAPTRLKGFDGYRLDRWSGGDRVRRSGAGRVMHTMTYRCGLGPLGIGCFYGE